MIGTLRVSSDPCPVGPHWTRITPAGVERPRLPLRQQAHELRQDVSRILTITRAEMRATYFGKSLGWLWLFLDPLLMAGMYWFLSAVLFGLQGDEGVQRFLYILVAIVFWVWFNRTVTDAPLMFTSFGSLLRDTDFPIHLVLGVTLAKSTAIMCTNFVVALFFLIVFKAHLGITVIALPVVLLTQFMLLLPSVMLLAMAGVFIKDLTGLLGQLLPIVWYLSPAMYPTSVAQQRIPYLMPFLNLNPFAHILPAYKAVFITNQWPDFGALAIIMLACLPFILLSFWLFHRARYFYYHFL